MKFEQILNFIYHGQKLSSLSYISGELKVCRVKLALLRRRAGLVVSPGTSRRLFSPR